MGIFLHKLLFHLFYKKEAFLFFILILFTFQAHTRVYPREYYIANTLKRNIFYDDFHTNEHNWSIRINDRSFRKIENGYIQCWANAINTPEFWPSAFSLKHLDIDFSKNFEIEAKIKCVKFNTATIPLIWGRDTSTIETYYFGYDQNMMYVVSKFKDEQFHRFKDYTYTPHLNKEGYNRLTVRSYDDSLFFFINKNLVHSMYKQPIPGKHFGFQVPSNSIIRVKEFRVSYIGEPNYPVIIKNIVDQKIIKWEKKGKFEKTSDYKNRTNQKNLFKFIKKQVQYTIDSIALKKYPYKAIRNEYNADNEFFTIFFKKADPIKINIPIDEAPEFDKHFNKILFKPHFTLQNQKFYPFQLIARNPSNQKVYTYTPGISPFEPSLLYPDYKEIQEDTVKQLTKKQIDQIIDKKEKEFKVKLSGFTKKMMDSNFISENVKTSVNAEVKEKKDSTGKDRLDYHIEYSYRVIKTTIENQTDDFPLGKYQITYSNAAKTTMKILKKTIENELSRFLGPEKKVTIKITGSTDASPIKSKIPYDEEYGEFINEPCFVNNEFTGLSISRESGITSNKQLAFLRTYGVRQFIESYIDPLRTTKNVFQHYAHVHKEKGDKYRRISVELIIHEVFDKNKAAKALEKKEFMSDVDVNIPKSTKTSYNTYALVIGNENYSSFQTGLNEEIDVKYAINDAHVFKKYLNKTIGVPKKNITYLENATSAQIKQGIAKIKRITEVTRGNARIMFYYSGHGLPSEKDKKPYLIPVDVNGSNVELGISLEYLYSELTKYTAKQVLVFLDACFSGGARNQSLVQAKGVKISPKQPGINGNLIIFSSSSGEQSSLVYEKKYHGFFTYFLLKKLQETRGKITLKKLAAYLNQKVSLESVLIKNKKQTPQILISPIIKQKWVDWNLDQQKH